MGCEGHLTQAFSVKHLTQAFLGEMAAIGGSRVWTRWHVTAAIGRRAADDRKDYGGIGDRTLPRELL
jgi:hypothetical protein